jgi:hypothetical protein
MRAFTLDSFESQPALRGGMPEPSPTANEIDVCVQASSVAATLGGKPSPLSDSNRRPPPYHGGALPTELRGRSGHRSAGVTFAYTG